MPMSVIRSVAFLAIFAATVAAQDAPAKDTAQPSPKKAAPEKKAAKSEAPQAAAGAAATPKKEKEERRVLRPEEVPGELMRLDSKADIKVELKIRTNSGRPVLFSGVIRNGKLIERIIDRRFVSQKSIGHPHCGVRIWWAGNTDGYIFFRFSSIETLTITGMLSAAERAEIMRRLRDKREGRKPGAVKAPKADKNTLDAKALEKIENMQGADRSKFLMKRFPADAGWTSPEYRKLKRKKIIDGATLSPEQELFVKYFRQLEQARYHLLRDAPRKREQFEPGSADDESTESPESPETAEPGEKKDDE